MKIKRYTSTHLTKFKQKLLSAKGSASQINLLKIARDADTGHQFVSRLNTQIKFYNDGIAYFIEGDDSVSLPDIPPKLSASEFINPTIDTINHWFSAWENLYIGDAANPNVWAYITLQMIDEEKLPYCDLMLSATDKHDETTGMHKIENALNAKGEEKQKRVDECVRNFLRRLCGLSETRGARSLYQDCPFAKAWWQCHIAKSVKNTDEVISLFQKKHVWTQLSDKMTSSLTVLGDENIRNGIIMFLTEKNSVTYHKEFPLKDLLTSVGIMTTWFALSYFPPEQVKIYIAELAKSIEKQPLGESTDTEDISYEESE